MVDAMWLFQEKESSDFEFKFKDRYARNNIDSLQIYGQLIDQSEISSKASFPMRKYKLVPGSLKLIEVQSMSNIKIRNILKQSGYTNIVLTELSLRDTSWIGNDLQTINYGYEDVGCRVYAHITQHSAEQTPLLKLLYELAPKNGSYPTEQELIHMKAIARKLKKHKAAVTMACGC